MDYKKKREEMVADQLKARDISDEKVLEAFNKVPRHEFVLDEMKDASYGDFPLEIGRGQTISQPYIVAKMTELLQLTGDEIVLEVGTGSGYQTAILCELAKEVVSIEKDAKLAKASKEKLKELGYKNFKSIVGDGTMGWEKDSPYDGIIVTAAAPKVPEPLKSQMAQKGRMVIPVGERHHQELLQIIRKGNNFNAEEIVSCRFVPLTGEYGW